MKTAPRTLLCLASFPAVLALSACQHTHIYAPDRVPLSQDGRMIAQASEPGEPKRSYPVEDLRVGEVQRDGSMAWLRPSPQDQEALQRRAPLPSADAIWVDVDVSGEIWDDYSVRGALIGGGIGLFGVVLFATVIYADGGPNEQREFFTGAGGALLYSLVSGLAYGTLVGLIDAEGITDHRLEP